MENNFLETLSSLIASNKGKFIGLLRRNGVLVSTKISNENLAQTILNAMQKSKSFKKETILLMSVLSVGDAVYSNVVGYNFDPLGIGTTSTPSLTNQTTTTSTTSTAPKEFSDTTVGTIFDKLMQGFNAYSSLKMTEAEKAKALASAKISNNQLALSQLPQNNNTQKSNVGLYIGLAIGGVALVGLLVYVIAKKQ